ncbi:hypothetical protein GWO43_28075, partial [candidate division KSB1 bacterium]|nr:hypothetical protein [candidate division KSB1 bacterium]NIS27794.1 hypothetical protein [candidate division KSB1 bacterium]NIT74648.1 hypothetical protein [candidate division KSB1 bacterium]NIU28461.1 hypothetical protein [candidate division KSB1 bacterium]NIU91722.1 hypothetical protein [candidate division KSB1 bacterium]
WWPGFYTEEIEILNGITTTDENGEFSIEFSAIPDPRISKEHKPVFNYEVHADVTDISGETRSATTNVQVGYTALSVDMQLPDNINKE